MRFFPILCCILLPALPAVAKNFPKAEKTAHRQGNKAFKKSVQEITEKDLRMYATRLASAEYEGRGTGDKGERMATSYLAAFFRGLGLSPEGNDQSYFQTFDFPAGMKMEGKNNLTFEDRVPAGFEKTISPGRHYQPLSFSTSGEIKGGLVFAGFGISAGDYDSFDGLEVKGRWVVVLRGNPGARPQLRGSGPLIVKANLAREKGAAGIIFVKGTNKEVSTELLPPSQDIGGGTILPALTITDQLAAAILSGNPEPGSLKNLFESYSSADRIKGFALKGEISAHIGVVRNRDEGRNVLARLVTGEKPAKEAIMIGAHIDHLGYGNRGGTRARGEEASEMHLGADDNASGVAAMMELAQYFAARKADGTLEVKRDLIFAGWSGEELGLYGSTHYAREAGKESALYPRVAAYLNLDMVGRLKEEGLNIQGTGSSNDWKDMLDRLQQEEEIKILRSANPYLPTDTAPLYDAGVPVLSIFTGLHDDYHTPRDTIETLNFPGLLKVTGYVRDMTMELARLPEAPGYVKVERNRGRNAPPVRLGIQFEAIEEGIRVSRVQEESAAARSGLQENDLLRKLNGADVRNRDELIAVLRKLEPGKEYPLTIIRMEKEITLRIAPEKR
ncbi:MAG: hypothetical protein CMN03_00480 [Roseibacillus sp.]|nr:hypothetical protein [Roseibacillus sp.]